jgi:hydrogenase maturation protein HypF
MAADRHGLRQSERVRVRLTGAVQGVGMRPFVHRLAVESGLAGFVRDGADGVTIEVEGSRIADFIARLSMETPSLARIDTLALESLSPEGDAGFVIGASASGRGASRIVPDAATCADCLADLFDHGSRFFGYPFVNCTQCGPRFTITRGLPYDRPRTAMAGFMMCTECAADYADPRTAVFTPNRSHVQPAARASATPLRRSPRCCARARSSP